MKKKLKQKLLEFFNMLEKDLEMNYLKRLFQLFSQTTELNSVIQCHWNLIPKELVELEYFIANSRASYQKE